MAKSLTRDTEQPFAQCAPIRRDESVRSGDPCEELAHREHRAALEATLFRESSRFDELVLELEAGMLRLRDTR